MRLRLIPLAALLIILTSALQATHVNPITSGADPFVTYTNGNYYFLRTTGGDIRIKRSSTLQGVGSGTETTIFGSNADIKGHIWAPELHYLDGKWYVYSCGSLSASSIIQRMFVLEGNSQDPMGNYTYKGLFDANTGALDETPLVRDADGAKFLVWSQWDADGQCLYIGPLVNPFTLGQPRVRISVPTYSWERNGAVNEGPIVLKRGGKTMIVYSGSGTWTPDYCLGMLVNTDGNFTNAASWTKFSNPIFRRRDVNTVYCVGHNSFTKSPSGAEDWIVYHGTSDPTGNQESKRNTRIQRFIWNSDGTPNLDVPVPVGVTFASPDEAPGAPIRGLRGEYFSNASLSGSPVVIATNATLDFDWSTGAPVFGVSMDSFSVRWTGMLLAPASGVHSFRTIADDGVRLWVNGQPLVNDWNAHPATTNTGTITLTNDALVPIRLEYFENIGGAQCQLAWIPPGGSSAVVIPYANLFPSSNGLRADYFSGTSFNTAALTRLDPQVNFDWGNGFPEYGVPADNFSARWTGQVKPRFSENYTFHTVSDDGVRLWVNNQLLVDNWTTHVTTTNSGSLALVAGQYYDIKLEYFESGVGAVARLEWSSASQAREVVPASQLFLPGTGSVANSPPSLSDVADRVIAVDGTTGPIALTVGDAETNAASLLVTGASSNTNLVPPGNIVVGGSGSNRTVTVTPRTNQSGVATITLTVGDGALTASDSFLLTVTNMLVSVDPAGAVPNGFTLVREWHWNTNGNTEGWTANSQLALALGTPTGGVVTATATNGDPMWISPAALSIAPVDQIIIEFSIRKESSDPSRMDLFWHDANGNFSGDRMTSIPATALPPDNQFHVVRIQYSGLIAAPLLQLRLDPISDAPGIGKTVGIDYFRIYTIGVASNTPPVVTLTSPPDGAVFFATNQVVLSATASDAGGAVTNVRFFSANTLLAGFAAAPYSLTLSNLAPGHYAFHAIAADNTGLRTTSAVANITIGFGAAATLIPRGATWRYFDLTNELGTAWRSNSFSDGGWSNGPARLGFGGDGEVTKIASNRQWTTYFRRQFYVPDPSLVTNLAARLSRDDGAVIYLNGAEVWRHNMPGGLVTNQTPASSTVSSPAETNWYSTNLSASLLQAGWNLLAAEVHQINQTSSDVGFDFELTSTQVLLQPPPLALGFSSGAQTLSWPADSGIFTLQTATNLTLPAAWRAMPAALTFSNGFWHLPLGGATDGQRFYRLQTP